MAQKRKSAVTGEPKVNKSAAIREYLVSTPNAKPTEIVAALKEVSVRRTPCGLLAAGIRSGGPL